MNLGGGCTWLKMCLKLRGNFELRISFRPPSSKDKPRQVFFLFEVSFKCVNNTAKLRNELVCVPLSAESTELPVCMMSGLCCDGTGS